jgi:hypothetical protein
VERALVIWKHAHHGNVGVWLVVDVHSVVAAFLSCLCIPSRVSVMGIVLGLPPSSKPLVDAIDLMNAAGCSLPAAHSANVARLSSPVAVLGNHSSSCKKGLGISSLPSTGEMTTRRVPRATMRPSLRYRMLPSSSVLVSDGRTWRMDFLHTCKGLFDFVEDEVHELVVALQCANDCGEC